MAFIAVTFPYSPVGNEAPYARLQVIHRSVRKLAHARLSPDMQSLNAWVYETCPWSITVSLQLGRNSAYSSDELFF